jgi:Methylase involved in ubiquinone/menaquinone biosynthesis
VGISIMSTSDSSGPSDHLLRTLAAVPVSSQMLDLGCGEGQHTESLLRLGFPVHACDPRPEAVEAARARVAPLLEEGTVDTTVQVTPLDAIEYPDATFNWVIADPAEIYVASKADLRTLFQESRRVLQPGGWLYVTLPASPEGRVNGRGFTLETMETLRTAADLAVAREPTRIEEGTSPRLRALYRRVEPQTPA